MCTCCMGVDASAACREALLLPHRRSFMCPRRPAPSRRPARAACPLLQAGVAALCGRLGGRAGSRLLLPRSARPLAISICCLLVGLSLLRLTCLRLGACWRHSSAPLMLVVVAGSTWGREGVFPALHCRRPENGKGMHRSRVLHCGVGIIAWLFTVFLSGALRSSRMCACMHRRTAHPLVPIPQQAACSSAGEASLSIWREGGCWRAPYGHVCKFCVL